METKAFIKRELTIWLILLLPVVYMFIVWDKLPDQFPIHWNINGEIDNYGSKWIFPILNIGIYFLMLYAPKLDPLKSNYEKFGKSYYIFRLLFICFFSIIFATIITSAIGFPVNIERIIVPAILVLFMIIGNYFATIRFNWFVGIRTPWTMTDETIWRKTHVLAGRLWFWGSLISLPISFCLKHAFLFGYFMSYVAIICLVPIVYSYQLFKKKNE